MRDAPQHPTTRARREIPAQVEVERRALRLVARPDIRQALESLGARWRDQSPGRLPETYAQIPASLAEIALFVAIQVVADEPRRPEAIEISAAPHRWFGSYVPGGRWGINNPDTLYFTIPVEPGSRYVITGRPHGDGPSDLNLTLQTPDVFGTVDNVGLRDLKRDADGSYRITVGDDPAEGRPNHLQIRGGATLVLVRNTLADWSRELPDSLMVDRTAGPAAGETRSEDAQATEVIRRLGAVIDHTVNGLQAPICRLPRNLIPQPGAFGDKAGFLVTQRNTLGHFRLGDSEALLATIDPGGAGYTGFSATNVWGVSPDSEHHQNSLNSRQAALNADGSYSVVLANWDPGIANWIDPAGLREGILMLRWQLLTGEGAPSVSTRLVERGELDAALPPDIARITPAQRAEQARQRAATFERRFSAR